MQTEYEQPDPEVTEYKTLATTEKVTLRGLTMWRRVTVGPLQYEFDRKAGTRELRWLR